MKRHIILAALAAARILPATASAAGTITGGPVKVAGGYTVFLQGLDGKEDRLTITIQRGPATDLQTDTLLITSGVQVTVRGASASIRGSLGSHGSVDLRFRGRKDAARKLPKGCKGSRGTTWSGRLVGTLRLRLPNGQTTTIRSWPASTYVGAELRCEPTSTGPAGGGDGEGDGVGGEPQLVLATQSAGFSVNFVATKRTLMLTRMSDPRTERGATVAAMTTVSAIGTGLLSVSGGGASATVQSAGRFTGTGAFSATTNMGNMAMGPLSGSLKVQPQGAPEVSIAGDPATLINGDKG
jgi:hypothetical protein